MNRDFTTLTALRDEWLALQPLSTENEARLWKKLRLEWNYHSNHIEGNTLTYGETELLLLHDRTTGNHSHREYLEMKAHDVGIEHVRILATDKSSEPFPAGVHPLRSEEARNEHSRPRKAFWGQFTLQGSVSGRG